MDINSSLPDITPYIKIPYIDNLLDDVFILSIHAVYDQKRGFISHMADSNGNLIPQAIIPKDDFDHFRKRHPSIYTENNLKFDKITGKD